jgi:hypothetical protein
MVVYEFGQDGSFVAGDTETGLTCYAYPTSPSATEAKRKGAALRIAKRMVAGELTWMREDGAPAAALCREYDARNWARLASRRMEALNVAEG